MQAEGGRSADPGGHDTGEERTTQEGRHRIGRDLSHMPEDEIRGWSGPPLQLLLDPLLCEMRRKSDPQIEQGTLSENL